MIDMDFQSTMNLLFCTWAAVLSFFGVKHYRRDSKSYEEILQIIDSLRGALNELKEELDRIKP